MSRIGAMIEYALAKVVVATGMPASSTSKVERIALDIGNDELPFCFSFDATRDTTLGDYRQREETTSISLAYVDKFNATQDPLSLLLGIYEDIEGAIWDANVLDTDGAGFFAYTASFSIGKTEEKADRYSLLIEVVFETTDVEDSAFALTET